MGFLKVCDSCPHKPWNACCGNTNSSSACCRCAGGRIHGGRENNAASHSSSSDDGKKLKLTAAASSAADYQWSRTTTQDDLDHADLRQRQWLDDVAYMPNIFPTAPSSDSRSFYPDPRDEPTPFFSPPRLTPQQTYNDNLRAHYTSPPPPPPNPQVRVRNAPPPRASPQGSAGPPQAWGSVAQHGSPAPMSYGSPMPVPYGGSSGPVHGIYNNPNSPNPGPYGPHQPAPGPPVGAPYGQYGPEPRTSLQAAAWNSQQYYPAMQNNQFYPQQPYR